MSHITTSNAGRKRKRDQNKKSTSRNCSKLRAKQHRDRKRAYYHDLEVEVKQLREEVINLQAQLGMLSRNLTPMNLESSAENLKVECNVTKFEAAEETEEINNNGGQGEMTQGQIIDDLMAKLNNEENFLLETLPQMLRTEPEKVKFTLMDQTYQNLGPFSNSRVKLIKTLFRLILENVISLDTKVVIMNFKYLSHTEWQRRVEVSRKGKRYNFAKNDHEPHKVFMDIFKELDSSETSVKCWSAVAKKYRKLISNFKTQMNKFVAVRNKILTYLNQIHHFHDGTDTYMALNKKDHLLLTEKYKQVKDHPMLNIFDMFDIKRKPANKDSNEDAELTE